LSFGIKLDLDLTQFKKKALLKIEKRRNCMSKSEQNLQDAFAGESQANRKYLAFAKKADQEGYAQG
jgi:hypothetical protein